MIFDLEGKRSLLCWDATFVAAVVGRGSEQGEELGASVELLYVSGCVVQGLVIGPLSVMRAW